MGLMLSYRRKLVWKRRKAGKNTQKATIIKPGRFNKKPYLPSDIFIYFYLRLLAGKIKLAP